MDLVTMRLDDLHPYERNPRRNDKAVDAVTESIKQCGYVAPIIVDENCVILAGHTRYKALRKLGHDTVQVIVRGGLTDEQKRKYRLLDNKTSELASWDMDLLAQELDGLDFDGFGIDWGIDQPSAVVEDNYEPHVPDNPRAKIGEVYRLGRHRLMCGDSTNAHDVAVLCDGEKMDMLLTDPPYNVDYHGTAGSIQNDNMDDEAFRAFLTAAFLAAKAALKPGAAFHVWHADRKAYAFHGALMDAGFLVRQVLVWIKNTIVLGRQDFQMRHEPCLAGEMPLPFGETDEYEDDVLGMCLYGWKDGKHYWFKGRRQSTILQFDKPTASKEHPTMKPVLLFDYEMKCNTKPEERVLDLFGGSGTTIVAAEQNGRYAYVMEYDPRYVDVIIDRWESLTGKKAERIG